MKSRKEARPPRGGMSARRYGWTVLFFVIVAALGPVLSSTASGADDPQAVLERVRRATGHEAMRRWDRGIVVEGTGESLGLESRFLLHLMADGRFRSETRSAQGDIEGFDGKVGWRVDSTGMPGQIVLRELEVRKRIAWVIGGFWLDAACPLAIKPAPCEKDEGGIRLLLSDRQGLLESILLIDKKTDLPVALSWRSDSDENRLSLADYRKVSGFLFPHTLRIEESGQPVRIDVERVREVSPFLVERSPGSSSARRDFRNRPSPFCRAKGTTRLTTARPG